MTLKLIAQGDSCHWMAVQIIENVRFPFRIRSVWAILYHYY